MDALEIHLHTFGFSVSPLYEMSMLPSILLAYGQGLYCITQLFGTVLYTYRASISTISLGRETAASRQVYPRRLSPT